MPRHLPAAKVSGSSTVNGSLFLNEMNGRCIVKALSCLQNVEAHTMKELTGGLQGRREYVV